MSAVTDPRGEKVSCELRLGTGQSILKNVSHTGRLHLVSVSLQIARNNVHAIILFSFSHETVGKTAGQLVLFHENYLDRASEHKPRMAASLGAVLCRKERLQMGRSHVARSRVGSKVQRHAFHVSGKTVIMVSPGVPVGLLAEEERASGTAED